jgi:hypothetical protein
MAIQHRRGAFSGFDPSRLLPGEWAIVLSGDEATSDGKAAYICFAAGTVKRVATWEDAAAMVANAASGIVASILADAGEGITALENRLSSAIDNAAATASARMDEVLLGAIEYANLSDACKAAIAQSAASGSSLITDEQGIAIIDDMAAAIVAGRKAGTLSDAEGLEIIDRIFA